MSALYFFYHTHARVHRSRSHSERLRSAEGLACPQHSSNEQGQPMLSGQCIIHRKPLPFSQRSVPSIPSPTVLSRPHTKHIPSYTLTQSPCVQQCQEAGQWTHKRVVDAPAETWCRPTHDPRVCGILSPACYVVVCNAALLCFVCLINNQESINAYFCSLAKATPLQSNLGR